jgi:hypothetical protein
MRYLVKNFPWSWRVSLKDDRLKMLLRKRWSGLGGMQDKFDSINPLRLQELGLSAWRYYKGDLRLLLYSLHDFFE